jgi:hypothetical protein
VVPEVKYTPRNTTLERLETEAREARRGLYNRTLFHRGSGDDLVEVDNVLVADATLDMSPRAAELCGVMRIESMSSEIHGMFKILKLVSLLLVAWLVPLSRPRSLIRHVTL